MSNDTRRPATRREIAHRHLTIRQTRKQDLEQIQPIGEVDLCTAPVLCDALAAAEERGAANVLVDLSEVRFLALVGVQILRAASERLAAERRRLVLAVPTHPVQRVFGLTDVTGELEIYLTMPSALSALSRA